MSTYYVRKSGNDSNGGTDPDTDAKLTIASAVSASSNDDTIDIGEGTWEETINAQRTFLGVNMDKTILSSAHTSITWSGYTIAFQNIRLILTGDLSEMLPTTLSFINSFIDFSGIIDANILWRMDAAGETLTMTNSIFYGSAVVEAIVPQLLRLGAANTAVVTNCVFYRFTDANWVRNSDATVNVTMKNCIFYNVTSFKPANTAAEWTYEDYNCWYSSGGTVSETGFSGGEYGEHDILVDPLFVDADGGDFRLQSSSPCIGAGHA